MAKAKAKTQSTSDKKKEVVAIIEYRCDLEYFDTEELHSSVESLSSYGRVKFLDIKTQEKRD